MQRRRFIIAVSGFLAIPGNWINRQSGGHALQTRQPPLLEDLKKLFADLDSAMNIGRAYLGSCKSNNLMAHLLHGLDIDPHASRRFNKTAFQLLRQKDFNESNTVLVHGWLMARSEVSACALLALLHKGRST